MTTLFNSQYGTLELHDMWTGRWTGIRWGSFFTHDGTWVNLPMSEVFVSYTK